MPVAGLVRLRAHQFGRQADFGTAVEATRAYPFKGVPENELNWTDPDIDEGSLDPITAPHREAPDLTASLNDPQVAYNSLPLMLSAFFGLEVSPTGGGTAKTWEHQPTSLSLDPQDVFTYGFGDDVLTDWFQLRDGILETVEFTIPTGLGAVTADMSWRFGHISSTGSTDSPVVGSVPASPVITVAKNEALLYGKDLAIYIADTFAGIAAAQILDAFHGGTIRFTRELDQKRYANGSQDFEVDAWATSTRMIEFVYRFAKTADTVGTGSESDHWMSDQAVDRFARFKFTSTAVAQAAATFYSWQITSPIRYYTRTEEEEGGNSVVVLTGHAFYDPTDADYALESIVVNTLTEADLGLLGS
jgi:hypothetical protein